MKLRKFEQSGFILETNAGFRLAFDIGNKTPVQKLENITADAMLVSHIHGDHFSLDQIKMLSPKDIYLNQECIDAIGEENLESVVHQVKIWDNINIGGIDVKFFNVDHGPNVSAPLAENFGFLISADNKVVYFAGDMFNPSGITVSSLEVDFALIPVGTHYTFGPEEAFSFVKSFKKIGKIISMHYEMVPESRNQFLNLAKSSFDVE